MGPQMDSLLYAILGSLLRNSFIFALVDPTDRYLRAWKPVPSCLQFDQQRVLSRFFSFLLFSSPSFSLLLLPSSFSSLLLPLLTVVFSTIMAKRKVTGEELKTRAEFNGYKKETH
jgi:hypothetical protein